MRFLIIFIFIPFTNFFNAQSWYQLTDFPGSPRDDAAGFSINDKHYCGTGRDDGFNCTRDFFRFNGTLGIWEPSTPLPDGENRQYAVGFAYNGNGYILCGNNCSSGYLNSFWMFESITEQWITLPSLPAQGRAGSVHFIIGDSLYLIGGQNTTGMLNEVWRYCFSTQEWQQKNNLPISGIWRGLAFSYSGSGYIASGKSSSTTWNSQTLEYDPFLDNWSAFSLINFGTRTYIGTVQRDSCLYVFGGIDSLNQTLNTFEKINIIDFSTQTLPDFSAVPRKGFFCFSNNSDFYLTTGISGTLRLKETWKIDNVMSTQLSEPNPIIVYPIPTSNYLSLEVEPTEIGQLIFIYDEIGNLVLKQHINSSNCKLFISHLPNGTYYLKYGERKKKIIKIN